MGEKIPHWLDKQNELNPDHIALETPEGTVMNFNELRRESLKMAESLLEKGIKPGDHVALLAENSSEFPIYIHALSYVGATIVLLNIRLTPNELVYQLNDAQVNCLITGKQTEVKALEVLEEAEAPVIPAFRMDKVARKAVTDRTHFSKEIDLDQVFTMMYTSGTTGRPKAVMHTYGNHWYSAIASALNLGTGSKDKWLLCLPMFHVSGFSVLMKSVIYGMTVHLVNNFDERVINESIMERGVTHISVVTVMMQRLMNNLQEGIYPEHFRCMLLGGGPVPEPLLQQAATKGIPVFQTYGMTETSSQIATLSPESANQKIGSAGKPLSLAQLWIDNNNAGEVGEIIVKGPMVSSGYYNHPSRAETYFRTGDLGYKDSEGFLYVVDRVKDMIISGGENVYPAEIESVLTGYPGVIEAGVTGMKDDKWGEVPVAFLVVDNGRINQENLSQFCYKSLAKYKVPKEFHQIQQLPRNASNKLMRRELFSALEKERNHEH
ncbi:2-succinylbenzoate-CoA ligase [Halobacillus halophilus]|uniref:2-succinylbenzoate--CoA ligase n=1 Tax=Halobacillus halophilus (strain ATCC 35676 / DSM 2266 / JCM 20832 / KCTC 3685 / LMG 17431 / NBRC 102448 / NCIMB 2269) TaxID=866895 RepID=I0JPY3_HALH3|nr:o-succinylbenzoate--CoA ligase [Halobacillus halophilus]ASF40226.1 2-succinylbenzoate-CoA ligase [Halobacillus halophilus]CCG46203.1 O-succinylbenzoic acid--CoA ligase [Halobacillus halophilus DSM 2266]